MYRRALAITVAVIVVAAVGGIGWWVLSGVPEGTYYTQVDNAKAQELESKGGIIDPTGGMSLQYTLPAYNEDGARHEIAFGTERELRNGAYLQLTVVPIRGVTEWTEVQYEDIPPKAREHLPQS